MTMTAAEVLSGVYQRMGKGDWDGVYELLADDFTVVEPESLPYGGLWEGKDALQRLYPAVMAHFDDPAPVIKEVIGGKEWGAVIVDFTVTSKKTGRRFTQTVSEVGRVVEGKLVELQIHYFDTAALVAEIG